MTIERRIENLANDLQEIADDMERYKVGKGWRYLKLPKARILRSAVYALEEAKYALEEFL